MMMMMHTPQCRLRSIPGGGMMVVHVCVDIAHDDCVGGIADWECS